MTDPERRAHALDRRKLIYREGGRRATDPQPSHGTRASYQASCRCTPCRAANAQYEAQYRVRRRAGEALMAPAAETWRQLRLLVTEYETRSALARRLGFSDRHIQFDRRRVRASTASHVRRIYERDILEAVDDSGPDLQ